MKGTILIWSPRYEGRSTLNACWKWWQPAVLIQDFFYLCLGIFEKIFPSWTTTVQKNLKWFKPWNLAGYQEVRSFRTFRPEVFSLYFHSSLGMQVRDLVVMSLVFSNLTAGSEILLFLLGWTEAMETVGTERESLQKINFKIIFCNSDVSREIWP